MSEKELRVSGVIDRVLNRTLRVGDAASELNVDRRTITRLKEKVREGGTAALAHASRGKPSRNRLPVKKRKEIEKLLTSKYPDFGPTFAAEKLSELHGLDHDPKTISAIMHDLGLWKPRRQGKTIIHRAWRERRACRGELVQYDGSPHRWFEDRAPEASLLAAVDDATGELVHASFAPDEGTLPTMGFWQEYIEKHGAPRAIYLDKFSTYRMNHETARDNPDTRTQFARAMKSLNIELIFANSPQAKGRVERRFKTLQDRLVKELRLRKIKTREEANRFLIEIFIPDFNKRFAKAARDRHDLHRRLTEREEEELPKILSKEVERTIMNDFTVPHGAKWYQLLPTPRLVIRPKETVIIRTGPDGKVTLTIRERVVDWKVIAKEKALSVRQKERQQHSLVPA